MEEDLDTKSIFTKLSTGIKHYRVSYEGKVLHSHDVKVHEVSIDSNGLLHAKWSDSTNEYDSPDWSRINDIESASGLHITGLFTSDLLACHAALAKHKNSLLEKRKHLLAELENVENELKGL